MMNNMLILWDIFNIISISIINYFYNFKNYETKIGYYLKNILVKGGPIAIKIGQCISSRTDILPLEICNILSELTNDVKYSYDCNNPYFKKKLLDFDLDINNCTRIGSGTIAVVYKTKVDNRDIVIKIKRPNIEYEIERSFRIIYFCFTIYSLNSIDIPEKLVQLKSTLLKQTDFINECNELHYFYDIYKSSSEVIVPKPYIEYCSNDIVTMSYIDGITLDQLSVENKKIIGKLLWKFAFESCFIHGKYHSDLHKGNLLLTNDKKLCILDYGLTGKLSGFHKSIIFNYNAHLFKKQWRMAAKIYVNKMVEKRCLCNESKCKFIDEVEEILRACLSQPVPNMIESVYQLEKCSKKNNTKFNNNYCDFELAFSTLTSTLYGLNCVNIFDFDH